jgi:hypothetical protein
MLGTKKNYEAKINNNIVNNFGLIKSISFCKFQNSKIYIIFIEDFEFCFGEQKMKEV